MNTQNNFLKSREFINQWLVGAAFIGFRFNTNFTLFFEREFESCFEGRVLPAQFCIELLEEWWFGNQQEWESTIKDQGEGIQPDEPVKAFELAKLRWSSGAAIKSVHVEDRKLLIFFENGTTVNAILTEEDEFSFSIRENFENNSYWSLTLDSHGFHLRTP